MMMMMTMMPAVCVRMWLLSKDPLSVRGSEIFCGSQSSTALLINIIALDADSLQQLAHLNFYKQAPQYDNEPKTVVQLLCNCFILDVATATIKLKYFFYFSFIAVVATAKIHFFNFKFIFVLF